MTAADISRDRLLFLMDCRRGEPKGEEIPVVIVGAASGDRTMIGH
jgi:hypothetical protein